MQEGQSYVWERALRGRRCPILRSSAIRQLAIAKKIASLLHHPHSRPFSKNNNSDSVRRSAFWIRPISHPKVPIFSPTDAYHGPYPPPPPPTPPIVPSNPALPSQLHPSRHLALLPPFLTNTNSSPLSQLEFIFLRRPRTRTVMREMNTRQRSRAQVIAAIRYFHSHVFPRQPPSGKINKAGEEEENIGRGGEGGWGSPPSQFLRYQEESEATFCC